MKGSDIEKIVEFISAHTVLTLATTDNGAPYCASCFYALDKEEMILIFLSDRETNHIEHLIKQPHVAGTIHQDKLLIKSIQGVQFQGDMISVDDKSRKKELTKIYYKKYPYAKVMGGDFWFLQLSSIKMTDNTLAFGKKRHWER